MIALAWSQLEADRAWLGDRGFVANLSRGLLGFSAGSRGRQSPA
jgi:hypothetical protein